MQSLVIMKDRQAVTSSLQVAEGFDKRHGDVMRAIDNKIHSAQNCAQYQNMFAEDIYQDKSGKWNKMYYMNRDGFTFIAMGFTGSRADEFKLKYIQAFNEMESYIKNETDTSQLSPELQFMNNLVKQLTQQEMNQRKLESKVDNISKVVSMDSRNWRRDAVKVLRKIAIKRGGLDQFKETANESYLLLESRGKCDLSTRLNNRKKNMIAQGIGKTQVKNLNNLDVIAEDARLIEIYVSVIKDMAIRNDVDFERGEN